MKRLICVLLAVALLCGMTSCSGYVSSYSAIGLVRVNTKSKCEIRFMRLDGTCVFKLRNRDDGEGELRYTASLESGEVNVYYDANGVKELLVHLKAGESVEGCGGYFEGTGRIYVIVETVGSAAEGRISVELCTDGEEVD